MAKIKRLPAALLWFAVALLACVVGYVGLLVHEYLNPRYDIYPASKIDERKNKK